jgi:hypothetical protein
LPATPSGDYLPPSGARVPAGLARDDPRWTRPLPWINAAARDGVRTGLLAVLGLALLNVVLPLAVLRLVAGRRPWSLRLLMALPVAAAVPLTAFLALEPLIPILPDPFPASAKILFTLGTLVGTPVAAYLIFLGWSLVRRRWRTLALLAGLTVLASLAIGLAWLWVDLRAMPAIERYGWSGWYLAMVPGAYAASLLMLIGWAMRGISRWLGRLGRRPSPAAQHLIH